MSKKIRVIRRLCPPTNLEPYNYTPYNAKRVLLEEIHIYKKNDVSYNKAIEDAVISCLNDLKFHYVDNKDTNEAEYTKTGEPKETKIPQLYDIRNNADIQYAKYTMDNIISGIDSVDVYIGYTADEDSDVENAVNLTSAEECEVEEIKPITQTSDDHIIKAAIVIEVPSLDSETETICIGTVAHELKHMLHKINSTKLAEKAGWAFAYAYMLCNHYKINGIPNYENLEELLKKGDKSRNGLISVMAIAMYILDSDELQCWRESFNYRDIKSIRRSLEPQNVYKIIPAYKSYAMLYKGLKFYFKELCEISRFLDDYSNAIVTAYFKQCHNIRIIPGYDLKTFIKHKWIPALENQLKTLRKIHHDNLQKHNKLQKEIQKSQD